MHSKIDERNPLFNYPFGRIDNKFLNQEQFTKYLRTFNSLEGWFELGAVKIFEALDYIQKENNIQGDLFEIGAYCGKSVIMLGLMVEYDNESVGVCDIFDTQDKNISGSGYEQGNKDHLLANLNKYFDSLDFLKIYQKSSQELIPEEIGTGYRFFHIDGGHSSEETLKDISLAEKVISKRGVIIIDDYFNPFWPGVSGGACKFLMEKPGRLAPLLIGHNKFIFCRPSEHKWYLKEIQSGKWKDCLTELKFYPHSTDLFGFNPLIIADLLELGRKLTTKEKIFRLSKILKFKSKLYRKLIGFLKSN